MTDKRKSDAIAKPWHAFLLTYLAFSAGMRLVHEQWVWFWVLAATAVVQAALIADEMRRRP